MPLFRVETRSKARPSDPAPPPRRGRDAARRPDGGAGLLPVIAGGALALLLLAGVGAVLLRGGPAPTAPATPAGPGAAAPAATGDLGLGLGVVPTPPPLTALAGVPPLNVDFPRESMVASINGQPYLMADLEIAVRVARAIATLSAEPVPNYDDVAGMRAFQVRLLRRQIDALLLEAASRTLVDKPPPLSADELINGLLSRQGAARQQLTDAVASNGIDASHVVAFLKRAGEIDLYIQSEILKDLSQEERQDTAKRDALVAAWLDQAWAAQQVQIFFYDPDTVLPAEEGGAPATQP